MKGFQKLRIDYGPGYRVYYKQCGQLLAILLGRQRQAYAGQGHQNRLAIGKKSIGVHHDKDYYYEIRCFQEHLTNPEEMAAYLEACIEEANGDAAFIAKALGDIARAKGMSQVARDAGLSVRASIRRSQGREPGFDTILKVIAALGLTLHAEAAHAHNSTAQRGGAGNRRERKPASD